MAVATPVAKKTSPQRSIETLNLGGKSLYAAKQSRFTTSKLIQNLGSGNNGGSWERLSKRDKSFIFNWIH